MALGKGYSFVIVILHCYQKNISTSLMHYHLGMNMLLLVTGQHWSTRIGQYLCIVSQSVIVLSVIVQSAIVQSIIVQSCNIHPCKCVRQCPILQCPVLQLQCSHLLHCYWHRRFSVEGEMPLLSAVQWWIKTGWGQATGWGRRLCLLQFCDTVNRVRPMYTSDNDNRQHRSMLKHRRISVGKSPISIL